MKILVVGDGHSELHEVAVAEAFRRLGHQVEAFHWHTYFRTSKVLVKQWLLAQNKFLCGPKISSLNSDLLNKARVFLPELVFIYRGTHITADCILALKRVSPTIRIFGYNNDNPFAPGHPRYLWRNFIASVPLYDVVFSYRSSNIQQLLDIGAKRVHLLRSWFVPWLNFQVQMTEEDRRFYDCDVVFVGHFERDDRVALLEYIVRRGWKLRLFGPGYDWDPVLRRSPELAPLLPIRLVWGEEYNKALCGAKVALCFFSKLNRDTYTRRCFEIPATRTMMLSEYSDDLATLFREGEEAEFFRSEEEMIRKLDYYLSNPERRTAVAEAGLRRVHGDGHDAVSRMRQVLTLTEELKR